MSTGNLVGFSLVCVFVRGILLPWRRLLASWSIRWAWRWCWRYVEWFGLLSNLHSPTPKIYARIFNGLFEHCSLPLRNSNASRWSHFFRNSVKGKLLRSATYIKIEIPKNTESTINICLHKSWSLKNTIWQRDISQLLLIPKSRSIIRQLKNLQSNWKSSFYLILRPYWNDQMIFGCHLKICGLGIVICNYHVYNCVL